MENKLEGRIIQTVPEDMRHDYNSQFPIDKIEKRIEKLKYYYPEISDIRVGYECEIKRAEGGWSPWVATGFSDKWNKDNIRTPYLIKEQIEGEGWKAKEIFEGHIINNFRDYIYTRKDGSNYYLRYRMNDHVADITRDYLGEVERGYFTIFSGYCYSINEFRYINKLLGI